MARHDLDGVALPDPPRRPRPGAGSATSGAFPAGPPLPPALEQGGSESSMPVAAPPDLQPASEWNAGGVTAARPARRKRNGWLIAAVIVAAVLGGCVLLAVVATSYWLRGFDNSSSAPVINSAEARAAIVKELKSAYGTKLDTYSVDVDSRGTALVRYHLKSAKVELSREIDPGDTAAGFGLAPPLASEPDKLSTPDTIKLMNAWTTVTGRSVGRMLNLASVLEGDAMKVTYAGHTYPITDIWFVESSDAALSWAFRRDAKSGIFVAVQKNPPNTSSP